MKIRTLASTVLLLPGFMAMAQTMTNISSEEILVNYGGQQVFSMSPNGRYVCGATFAWSGFIYDAQEGKDMVFTEESGSSFRDTSTQLLDINDMGTAVGFDDNGGIIVNMDGSYEILESPTSEVKMVLPQGINADGSVIVGSVADDAWVQRACYWKNGERKLLPMLTSEEAGSRINGSSAMDISEDGTVILGYVNNRENGPMVIWTLNEDGEYDLNPVFLDKYETDNIEIKDEEGRVIGYERGDRPYLVFTPAALSPDGKTVAMQVVPNKKDESYDYRVAFYDVESGNIEVIENPDGVIEDYGYFVLSAVSNDKVAVGYAGILSEAMNPFILYGETGKDLPLAEAFPDLALLQEYQERQENEGMPFLATGISANGQYITGYGVMIYEDVLSSSAFIINTTGEAGVNSIQEEGKSVLGIYSIDGKKLNRLMQGVNIIKYSDGKSKKIFIK